MQKKLTLFIGFVFVLTAFLTVADTVRAEYCNGNICATLITAGGNGSPASASVRNRGTAIEQVRATIYKVFIRKANPGWLDTQELFAEKVVTLTPGQTLTVSLPQPGCLSQFDIHRSYPQKEDYDTLLLGEFSSDANVCVKSCQPKTCSQLNYQCGNVSDGCGATLNCGSCSGNQSCQNGHCVSTCSNICKFGDHQCMGSSVRICGKYDNSGCTTWGSYQSCDSRCYSCGDGKCECGETQSSCPQDCGYNTPTVDIRSSGSVTCNDSATLTWTSTNATSCSASDSWSGGKSTSGSESVGSFTGTRTYKLTCSNGSASAWDSVTLNGSNDNLDISAGSDKRIDRDESVKLNGSVDGNYDSLTWKCTSGTLSNYHALQPTYRAPDNDYDYDYDKTYTCTLTAKNECGTDSDTVKITVDYENTSDFKVALTARPKSACAPFNNVDMIAELSNYGNNDYDYTYYFDCDNDGDWEKTVTTDKTEYTAVDLCDYANVGSYTAKVKVTGRNRTATDTDIVRATDCGVGTTGSASITKTVKNITRGYNYQGTVTANPLDTVSYKIVVGGVSGISKNVLISDVMPGGIDNIRELEIDGYAYNGNITNINLGTLTAGQTKIITYTATVAGETNFAYGQTTLNNVATVNIDGDSASSNAAVVVYRQAILGATTISTGFDSNASAGLGVALIAAIATLLWMVRKNIAGLLKPKTKA